MASSARHSSFGQKATYDQPVTMSFRTVDGSARSAEDYVAKTGTLTFAPGRKPKAIFNKEAAAPDKLSCGRR